MSALKSNLNNTSQFALDLEDGIDSEFFSLKENLDQDDQRPGTDKDDVVKIMRSKSINFDEARLMVNQERMKAMNIDPNTGLPLDNKAMTFCRTVNGNNDDSRIAGKSKRKSTMEKQNSAPLVIQTQAVFSNAVTSPSQAAQTSAYTAFCQEDISLKFDFDGKTNEINSDVDDKRNSKSQESNRKGKGVRSSSVPECSSLSTINLASGHLDMEYNYNAISYINLNTDLPDKDDDIPYSLKPSKSMSNILLQHSSSSASTSTSPPLKSDTSTISTRRVLPKYNAPVSPSQITRAKSASSIHHTNPKVKRSSSSAGIGGSQGSHESPLVLDSQQKSIIKKQQQHKKANKAGFFRSLSSKVTANNRPLPSALV
eukprot:Awhi_evm1s10369